MEQRLFDREQLAGLVDRLAADIIGDLGREPAPASPTRLASPQARQAKRGEPEAVLVGIRRRGIPLAQRLAKKIQEQCGQSLPVGTLDITFYRDDLSQIDEQPVVGVTEIPFSVSDRKIYLVDDVLFTGRTIRAAIDSLLEFGRPSAIRLVALIDRGHRELPIQADFVGTKLGSERDDNVQVKLEEIDGVDEISLEKGEGRGV